MLKLIFISQNRNYWLLINYLIQLKKSMNLVLKDPWWDIKKVKWNDLHHSCHSLSWLWLNQTQFEEPVRDAVGKKNKKKWSNVYRSVYWWVPKNIFAHVEDPFPRFCCEKSLAVMKLIFLDQKNKNKNKKFARITIFDIIISYGGG